VTYLFEHFISVLLNVTLTTVPERRFQHFLCKANFVLRVSNKDMYS